MLMKYLSILVGDRPPCNKDHENLFYRNSLVPYLVPVVQKSTIVPFVCCIIDGNNAYLLFFSEKEFPPARKRWTFE